MEKAKYSQSTINKLVVEVLEDMLHEINCYRITHKRGPDLHICRKVNKITTLIKK